MSFQDDLAVLYGRNTAALKKHIEGLTQQDTVKQAPFNVNCMNWVVGHVIGSRDGALKLLGEKPLLTEAQAKRYGYGSAPVCADDADVMKLDQMVKLIDQSQEKIVAGLKRITAADLAKTTKSYLGETPVSTLLLSQFGHDSNHVGQAEMLRELALKK